MGRRCLILALTALLLTGCAGSPGQSAAALAPAESDRVVIYTSHKEEVYGPIVKEFEARTGIWAAVAGGSCRVGVTLEETALKRQAQGADIAIVYPEEGTSAVPDGSALIAGAPHPDNARAFLDFAQSRDVQELVVSQFSRRSVRTDVSDGDALPPADELALIDYPVRWAAELKDAFSARWPELLREDAPS